MKHFQLHFDGGCIPNPGRGYGSFEIVGLLKPDGWRLRRERIDFGHMTNNMAEYQALCCGLEALFERTMAGGELSERGIPAGRVRLSIFSDSQLVVKCLNNGWRVKSPRLGPLHECARNWLKQFGHWSIKWNPRAANVARFGH